MMYNRLCNVAGDSAVGELLLLCSLTIHYINAYPVTSHSAIGSVPQSVTPDVTTTAGKERGSVEEQAVLFADTSVPVSPTLRRWALPVHSSLSLYR